MEEVPLEVGQLIVQVPSALSGYNQERPIGPWLFCIAANGLIDHWWGTCGRPARESMSWEQELDWVHPRTGGARCSSRSGGEMKPASRS